MNFLAHLYLSPSQKDILLGNFFADSVKGKQMNTFNHEIQIGIQLHRQIDFYTDTHPIVKKSKRRLHPRYRHYAGVIIDIFYDHFLALNWNQYSSIPLDIYVDSIYELLLNNKDRLPERTQQMLPFMIQYNWLYNYQFLKGIENVLEGMNRRTKNKSQMNLAIEDLTTNHQELQNDFHEFFPELIEFTKKTSTEINP